MRKLIRLFGIWLIAIAIPLQGFASIAMMNCEQSSRNHSQNEIAKHNHHEHNCHDIRLHDNLNVSDTQSHSKDNIKHSCAHCVKCTSCCTGFTFQTNSSDLIQQLQVVEARSSFSSHLFTGFIPSGLERPPRFTLI